ncbi:MAG: WD40 repeat domain-containing protein, partial [Gemmataceae bacterium]|nr:WD40 repeat domain-containing protein [Gemmataceae bacterium]
PGAAPPEPAPPPRVAAEPARLAGVTARYGTLHYRTPGPVLGSALSPDGQLLAVANPDGVRLYEVPGWRLARELAAPGGHHQVCLRPLAFSPDGTHLAYRREYGVVTVWDLPGGKPGRDVRAGADTKWRPLMAFVAGNLLALAEVERLVVFDPATGAEVRAVPAANVLAVSPDGATYLRADKPKPKPGAGTHPGEAVLGDARTGKDTARLGRLAPLQDGGRDGLAFAPDGKTVAVVYGSGRTVSVRDATTGKEVAALELPEDIYGGGTARFGKYGAEIGHARDGTVYVLLGSGGVVRWDPKADRELPGLEAGDDPVPGGVHLLPDGQTLLTPTTEGWVRVWDAGTGAERPVPGRYWGRVVVTLSPDGAVVAVADGSGRVDLRDAASGAFVRTVREKGGPAPRVVFSPDGGRLAVADTADPPEGPPEGDPGPPVTVYRAADGVAVGRVGRRTDEGGRAVPVGFTAGGLVLVQGTDPGLTAWDPATGAKVWGDPAGHPGGAASPDGRTVAVVEDHTLVFLDAETGKETRRAVLLPRDLIWWDEEAVCQVSWSADGRTAAVLPPGCHPIVLDVRTGRVRRRFGAESDADGKARRHWAGGWDGSAEKLTLGLSPDGSWAVVAGGGHAAVWQTATGARVAAV